MGQRDQGRQQDGPGVQTDQWGAAENHPAGNVERHGHRGAGQADGQGGHQAQPRIWDPRPQEGRAGDPPASEAHHTARWEGRGRQQGADQEDASAQEEWAGG